MPRLAFDVISAAQLSRSLRERPRPFLKIAAGKPSAIVDKLQFDLPARLLQEDPHAGCIAMPHGVCNRFPQNLHQFVGNQLADRDCFLVRYDLDRRPPQTSQTADRFVHLLDEIDLAVAEVTCTQPLNHCADDFLLLSQSRGNGIDLVAGRLVVRQTRLK